MYTLFILLELFIFFRLKYVEAVLLEVLRHATIVPISVAHRCLKSVSFDGYLIPKVG